MSERPDPNSAGGMGAPVSRPHGEGIPPKTGGGPPVPNADDSVDAGMGAEGDRGPDAPGGMIGEG